MKAIGKYIVLNDTNEKVVSKSGIQLSAQDVDEFRYKQGVVVAPGTDVTSIKEGDKIYYDKGRSFKMMIDGSSYTIIREDDVVVVGESDSYEPPLL